MEFRNRGKRMDEALRLLRHLFSGAAEPFQGAYYSYEDGVFDPLPVQGDKLPILLGGNSDAALKRAATAADAWESTGLDIDAWKECARKLRDFAGGRRLESQL
jgi:alkanesulfonate monooxygenase SsuD/methylene tetrahydromethanopterin reductase-like flavin-dependent oxidoreductase (luciferase family)